MKCTIRSLEESKEFDGITSITLPVFSGELQVLPGHAESFIALEEGKIALEGSGKTEFVPVKEGIGYLKGNSVFIIL